MTLAAIVPVKGLAAGKGRLAEVLAEPERAALNRSFLKRTLDLVAAFGAVEHRIVASADPEVLAIARGRGMTALPERAPDLNAALEDAVMHADALGATRILVLAVDLPCVRAEELVVMTEGDGIAIAPDRSGRGTNALYLPEGVRLRFAYGKDSFAAHFASARAIDCDIRVIRKPGLAFDVDTPDDYREWLRRKSA
jgi:2-phospho-L-lactate guanylyltransferase